MAFAWCPDGLGMITDEMVLRFGPHALDTVQRRLFDRENGQEIRLTPKAFELLKLLVEQRPRALAKDEIMGKIWPGVFVSENNLATLVRDLRAALHDDPDEPRYVRTVFGFGYAFVGRVVSELGEDTPSLPSPSAWRLVLEGRDVQLYEGVNVVGRTGPGVIVIDAPTISRRHARIMVDGPVVRCEDLGSKNGTWLESTRLEGPTVIPEGVPIRFGSVLAVLRLTEDSATTDTVGVG